MSLELHDEDYVVGIWEAPLQGTRPGNWMMTLYRTPTEWRFHYRFRYFMDDKLFHESKDERSEYAGKGIKEELEEVMVEKMHTIARIMFPGHRYIPVGSGPAKMLDILAHTDGFFMRVVDEVK